MNFFSNWLRMTHNEKDTGAESIEAHRKRIYVLIGITAATPVLIGYGLFFWIVQDKPLDAILNFSLAAFFFVIAILLKKKSGGPGLFRFGMACLAFLLVYNVGFGPYGESESLWLIIYPLVAFFLFGTREGLCWIALVTVPSAVLILFPGPFNAYSYPTNFRVALVIAVILSVALSYMLESLRASFSFLLEKQNAELRDALAEVNKLSGLIPICSYCKEIRDDKGYWNKIETYIQVHSDAKFSHSICPKCSKLQFPDLDIYDEDDTQG